MSGPMAASFGLEAAERHFLTKTRPRVQTEMNLHVLAYNLRRIISLYGPKGAMNALRWAAA